MKTFVIILTVAALAIPIFTIATISGRPEVRACVALIKDIAPQSPTLPAFIECAKTQ